MTFDWASTSWQVGSYATITFLFQEERIPSLNQYGLAILVLLMLGMGIARFRRFGDKTVN